VGNDGPADPGGLGDEDGAFAVSADAASLGSASAGAGKVRLSNASTRRNRSAMIVSRSASFRCNSLTVCVAAGSGMVIVSTRMVAKVPRASLRERVTGSSR